MKTTFQKTLIAAATGVVLMSAVGTASANSLLFPYFTTASGAQSVLSLTANTTAAAAGETLHYVYNYGDSCTHYDGNGKVTSNDLMQHSIASPAAGGFGKAVGSDTSTPFHFPLANTQGFLVVSTKTTAGAIIAGDMAIVDPATGMVVSYPGISNNIADTTTATGAASEGNFAALITAATDSKFNLSFYPSDMVTTSWYGVVAGDMSTAISTGADWKGVATLTNNGVVYNNEESPFSGTVTKAITCAGAVTPAQLMNTAQAAAVGPNGGLIHATAAMSAGGTGLIMSKLQTVLPAVGAPFAGKTMLHRESGTAF